MGRRPRIHFAGAFYHVIARRNRGQKVFREDGDYRLYLRLLKEYKERFGYLLHGYALMPTHVHLLIETGETALSKVMQSLQFRYTRNFNIKYRTWGHLFQGRYKAILCEKDSYFLELSAYLHLNPVRGGLVDDPSEYPWSSYPAYMGKEKGDLVDRDFLFSQFSVKRSVARREYEKFVKSRLGQGHRDDFYKLKDQRFLGPNEFVDDVHHRVKEEPSLVYDIPIEELVSAVESTLGIAKGILYSFTRSRQGAWGRSVTAFLGKKWGGYQLKRFAEHFKRDPVAISKGVRGVEKRLAEDRPFAQSLEMMEKTLIQNKRPKIAN
jgi:REP element-mobilizing transposase RayT